MDRGILAVEQIKAALALQQVVDFDGGKLCLIKSDVPITRDTLVADMEAVKADFSGYAEATVTTWLAPFRDTNGNVVLMAATKLFLHNGGATDNVIYGWYFKSNGAGTPFVCGGKFASPITMSPTNPGLPVDAGIVIPPQ